MFCKIRALLAIILVPVFLIDSALADQKSEVVSLSRLQSAKSAFDLDLKLEQLPEGIERVPIRILCRDEAATPPLAVDESIVGNGSSLLNVTSSEKHGCRSYKIDILLAQLDDAGTSFAKENFKLAVGIKVLDMDPEDPRFGKPQIFVFNPVHGNWTKAKNFQPNQADPQRTYTTLTKRTQQIISGSISTPEAANIDIASHNKKSLSETPNNISPVAGLLTIPPVEPDAMGSAQVKLPLLLRPSRGPGPSFSIVNSPSGAPGVLGRGWDLSFARISVRGPSPLYHNEFETEDYQIDGQDLIALDGNGMEIPPLYKGGPILKRITTMRVFRTRDSSNGLIIRRYGDVPSNYYWEIWDPHARVTRLFGATLDGNKILREPNGILRGRVIFSDSSSESRMVDGEWGLTREYDNQIARSGASYEYEAPACTGNWNGDCTHALRLKRITYNQAFGRKLSAVGETGLTHVEFKWQPRREKIRYNSDGRLGFFRAQQYWLEGIEVRYKPPEHSVILSSIGEGETLALYSKHDFELSKGDDDDACLNFAKVLKSVTIAANQNYNALFSKDDSVAGNVQTFNFQYDGERSCKHYEWRESALSHDASFGDKVDSGIGFPDKLLAGLGFNILTDGSILGEKNSEETGGSLYVGIGPPGDTSRKSISGGIKAGYTFVKNRSGSTLLDITGDGIDDIVYRVNGALKYCAATRDKTNKINYDKVACNRPIHGLSDISVGTASVISVGAEVHFGVGFAGTGFNSSDNETYVYFTQRDNDGLIDAVVYGRVLYNQGEVCVGQNKCSVTFNKNSSLTPPLPNFAAEKFAALRENIKNRKPPGLAETVKRMGEKLAGVSGRLQALEYSQTTISWVAPLDGEISISGKFDLISKPLSSGLRKFQEKNKLAGKFETYHNDCKIWPDHQHCGPIHSPASFEFIPVPKAFVQLSISRTPDLSLPEKRRDEVNGGLVTTRDDTVHNVVQCAHVEMDRNKDFNLKQLLSSAKPICRGEGAASNSLKIRTNDVVYLTYNVHPDHTASLAPDAKITYSKVENDASWQFRPQTGNVSLEEAVSCQWGDHESGLEKVGKERCLIGKQNRYSFNLSSGLLPSNQTALAILPAALADKKLENKSRKLSGKVSIPTDLTRDYQIYFDVLGTTLDEHQEIKSTNLTQRRSTDLPLLFRQNVSDFCENSSEQHCIVELSAVSACTSDSKGITTALTSCELFDIDDAPSFVVRTRLKIEHTRSGRNATNLNSRLARVRWLKPPSILTRVKEVEEAVNKDFVRPIPENFADKKKALLTSDTSKIVSVYLPFQTGDRDKVHRRVEHGIFRAPNPSLNDAAGKKEVDIDFHRIMELERSNVGIARLRQRYRLCSFAGEIFDFLDARRSENTSPFASTYLDYWKGRIEELSSRCLVAKVFLETELEFTDNKGLDFELQNRLELPKRLQYLEYEDQLSSAETLLERVLTRLELPEDLLTDHPRLTRRGYRLPVKANPLDCKHLAAPNTPIENPITGPDTECQYRFLANFAMHDLAKMLFPRKGDLRRPSSLPASEATAYRKFLKAVFPNSQAKPAFKIEISALVNGRPIAFSELTGSDASSKDGKFPIGTTPEGRPLRDTCIGNYGVHNISGIGRYFYPDNDGEFFQRIVTNRRSGRAVAFSDDILSLSVKGINRQQEYKSVSEMESKQDCQGMTGQSGPKAKFTGKPSEVLNFSILENNRFVGRNRVFEFTAEPLDVIEFRVRLAPIDQLIIAKSDAIEFELLGNFSSLKTPFIEGYDSVLIPRAPSQIVPPLFGKTRCHEAVRHPNWASQNPLENIVDPRNSSCRPWTRLGWTELLLGASYRTYSDLHRASYDNELYSIQRRREILRLQPEIEIDATQYRLDRENEEMTHTLASLQYEEVSKAAANIVDAGNKAIAKQQQMLREAQDRTDEGQRRQAIEIRETNLSDDVKKARNVVAAAKILERVAFAQERTPNTLTVGSAWSLFAEKALSNGGYKLLAGYDVIRFGPQKIENSPEKPDKRFEQADSACVNRSGSAQAENPFQPKFDDCEKNLTEDGENVLAFSAINIFPLVHRFIGPVHVTALDAGSGFQHTQTDICASPLPEKTASCWKGQDDTIYLHREISDQPLATDQHGARSVSALIGFEIPLIERFLFEFDSYQRVACNWPIPLIETRCKQLYPTSSGSPITKTKPEIQVQASVGSPVLGLLPDYPNRPNPPKTENVLEVFAPIQRSKTRSVSTNSGLSLGQVSVNTSIVFNESETKTLYLDINGDGFPEIISDGTAKLTSPVGLLRDDWWKYYKNPSQAGVLHGGISSGYVQSSSSSTYGAGAGLTPSSFAKIKLKTMDASVSPSFDFSFEKGYQTQFRDFRDFNGDGIVDTINSVDGNIATQGGLYVGFNIGSSIRNQPERLTVPKASLEGYQFRNHYNTTNSAGFGVRLGYETDSGSFMAGMGLGNRVHSSEGVLMDFTGDGLVDIVIPASDANNNGIIVYPNLGNGFSHARLHKIDKWAGSESSVSETTLVDAGAAFTFGFNAVYVKVVFNPAVKHARNQTRELVHVRDMNADGYPDLVTVSGLFDKANTNGVPSLSLKSNVETKVYYNPTPKYHLLSKITNPSQTEYEVDYALFGNSGPELGKPIWAITKVSQFDGFDADDHSPNFHSDGHDVRLKTFDYSKGYFNRAEGTFYGFANNTKTTFGCNGSPTKIGPMANCSSTVLKRSQRRFYNHDYHTKGRLLAEVTTAPTNIEAKPGDSGAKIRIESAADFERVSISRVAYSLDDLQSVQLPSEAICGTIPQTRSPLTWSHGSYVSNSRLSERWSKVNPRNTNNGQVLGGSSTCGTDPLACAQLLTNNLCKAGFYAEQTQFWSQQSASVRERISDLLVYAPGTPAIPDRPIENIDLKTKDAIYSAAAADHDQWGHTVNSYSIGELSFVAGNQPIAKASVNSAAQYSDQNGLNNDVSPIVPGHTVEKDRPYPIAGLTNEMQLFEGAWPDARGPPIRIKQAIYSQDNRANLTDICHYPGGKGFHYRPDTKNSPQSGICAQHKSNLYSSLSDGLTSLQDALRKTYQSVPGLPAGDKDFTALIHSQFDYDDFGNLAKTISPLNKDREWIERRFNYEDDPFAQTATNVVLQRCVHDRRGVGKSSPNTDAEKESCQFGTGSELATDKRKAVNHILKRGIDAHHGKVALIKDPNGNGLLTDYDAWGRFRMLARDWGTAPRQNQTYKRDIISAATKTGTKIDQLEPWRILTIANYGWAENDRSYFSSHIRNFASSNAYSGASGSYDTTRHASNFSDGTGGTIQSIVEAEVCESISGDLLASKNQYPTDDLFNRCEKVSSGRVSPAVARDALGRQLASFEGYEVSDAKGQGLSQPMFGKLVSPTQPKKPLTTNRLDSGGRPLSVRSRIADAPHSPVPNAVVGTTQYSYRVVRRQNLDEDVPVNRFEAVAMSPRCAIKATRSDARGLITSVVENQSSLFRQTGDDIPGFVGAAYGDYDREHKDTLGYCQQIKDVVKSWPSNAEGAEAAAVTYQYDPLLQIRKVDYPLIEANRATISVNYDLHGRMTEMRDPDSGCSQYIFDGMHNLKAETRFAFESNQKAACGENSKVSSSKFYEHAADRLMRMTYSSLQEQGGDEDKRDTVNFFYDRYPQVAEDGEILEAPKLVPNDHANRRFVNVTGKICENCIGQATVVTDRTGARSFSFNELSQPKKEVRSIVGALNNVVPSEGGSEAFVPEVAFYELENSYSAFGDLTLQEFNESAPSNPSPECANSPSGGSQNCIARFTLGTRYAPDGSVSTLLFNGQPLINSAKDQINRPTVRWTHDGTTSGYYYDPFDLRMNQMATITAGVIADENGNPLGKHVPVHINGYQYDGGGNVLGYRNQADLKEKYRSLFNFSYDGANRLTGFTASASKTFKLDTSDERLKARGCYRYDLGHRFNSRNLFIVANPSDNVNNQCGKDFANDGGMLFARKWSYDYNNAPGPAKPVHAPSSISFEVQGKGARSTSFHYDDLGRMKKATSGAEANVPGVLSNRAMVWDAEGRLKGVRGGKDNYWKQNTDLLREKYVYDFGGNRTLKIHRPQKGDEKEKKAEEHTTIYLTPFYARSATGRGSVQIAHSSFPVATLVPPQNENAEPVVTYLYSDLAVGSATASVMATGDVADANATIISRREYSPYGHALTARKLAQPKGSSNPPLSVFHGKELDRVSGFSSFGARYYSRDIGSWLSPDPMQHAYLFGNPNKGTFNSLNINSFHYNAGSPTNNSDPSGGWVNFAVGAGKAGVENVALQKLEIQLGLRKEFSYSELAIDVAIGTATSGLSSLKNAGKLGRLGIKSRKARKVVFDRPPSKIDSFGKIKDKLLPRNAGDLKRLPKKALETGVKRLKRSIVQRKREDLFGRPSERDSHQKRIKIEENALKSYLEALKRHKE